MHTHTWCLVDMTDPLFFFAFQTESLDCQFSTPEDSQSSISTSHCSSAQRGHCFAANLMNVHLPTCVEWCLNKRSNSQSITSETEDLGHRKHNVPLSKDWLQPSRLVVIRPPFVVELRCHGSSRYWHTPWSEEELGLRSRHDRIEPIESNDWMRPTNLQAEIEPMGGIGRMRQFEWR